MEEVVKFRDISIVCGIRSRGDQNKAFAEGTSELEWPNGNHNIEAEGQLSSAVDIVPWPEQFGDEEVMIYTAGIVMMKAHEMGIKLAWGGHWQSLRDLWHFELT
jgi:peptidoglycan L-alanyl-D-glutamate endopeptidase CwlK